MRNKMASQPLIVNEILSYLLYKHSILRDNELKRIVLDYYNTDDITSARDTLLTDFENLKLGEDAPRFSDKVDYSASSCVDDMFIMLEYLENKYIVHLLPRYVTENLSNVPPTRMDESDAKLLYKGIQQLGIMVQSQMYRLNSLMTSNTELSERMAAIEYSFSRLNQNIVSIPAHSTGTIDPNSQGSRFIHRPGATRPYNSGPNSQSLSHGEINNTTESCNQPGGTAVMNESSMQGACDGLPTLDGLTSLSWEDQVECNDKLTTRDSNDKNDKESDDGYIFPRSRKRRNQEVSSQEKSQKKLPPRVTVLGGHSIPFNMNATSFVPSFVRMAPASGASAPCSNAMNVTNTHTAQINDHSDARNTNSSLYSQILRKNDKQFPMATPSHRRIENPKKKKTLIGRSNQTNDKLKASRPLVKKLFFYIGSVDRNFSNDDVKDYIENCVGATCVSSYQISESEPREVRGKTIEPFRGFRVAIVEDDVERFLNLENWPDGIIIRKWIFKTKNGTTAKINNPHVEEPCIVPKNKVDDSDANVKAPVAADEAGVSSVDIIIPNDDDDTIEIDENV